MRNLKDFTSYWNQLENKLYKIFILIFLLSNAQAKNLLKNKSQDLFFLPDSINKSSEFDSSQFIMKKSPWGAVLRSAILPGLGQFYNESYYKIPLVWGALIYLSTQWKNNNDSYLLYKELFNQSLQNNSNGNSNYYKRREFYHDQRDLFAIYIGLAYFLNLVDAYVDAHFFDFEVSENKLASFQVRMKIKL